MYYRDVLGLGDLHRDARVLRFLFLLFIRVLPVISIFEMRELVSVKEGPVEASDESVRPTPEDIPILAAPAARFEPVGEPGHFEEAEHPRPPAPRQATPSANRRRRSCPNRARARRTGKEECPLAEDLRFGFEFEFELRFVGV